MEVFAQGFSLKETQSSNTLPLEITQFVTLDCIGHTLSINIDYLCILTNEDKLKKNIRDLHIGSTLT